VDQRFYIHADPAKLRILPVISRFRRIAASRYFFTAVDPIEHKPLVVDVKWAKTVGPLAD